jgi:hypothetical protein
MEDRSMKAIVTGDRSSTLHARTEILMSEDWGIECRFCKGTFASVGMNLGGHEYAHDTMKCAIATTDKLRTAERIATDLLDGIAFVHGEDALAKVVNHIKTVNRVREDNAEIDALEKLFAAR